MKIISISHHCEEQSNLEKKKYSKISKFLALLGITFAVVFFLPTFSHARSYPIQEITLSNCTEDCTLNLPIINNADYFSYRNNSLYRRIYSMLRIATYYENRDVGMGSHQGIDIATAIGTPVYSSHSGEVIVAQYQGDRGNVITIKHEWKGKYIYTTYAHLSETLVEVGDIVEEGQEIGKVWSTGNSTGPHLHFQIETNQDGNHPYFPRWCKGTIDEIVNEGNCVQEAKNNTLDPIYFLEVTSKQSTTNEQPSQSIYISKYDITLEGFLGGFMQLWETKQITFSKNNSGSFLTDPITVQVNENYLSATPGKIQVLEGERSVFLQTTGSTGLALVEIKYGNQRISYFPILISDTEQINKRKKNTKIIQALYALGINI